MIENGYEIRGNLAATGRHYQVCNSEGEVLADIHGSINLAIADAQAREPGAAKAAPPPPEPEEEVKPKATRKKKTNEGK